MQHKIIVISSDAGSLLAKHRRELVIADGLDDMLRKLSMN